VDVVGEAVDGGDKDYQRFESVLMRAEDTLEILIATRFGGHDVELLARQTYQRPLVLVDKERGSHGQGGVGQDVAKIRHVEERLVLWWCVKEV